MTQSVPLVRMSPDLLGAPPCTGPFARDGMRAEIDRRLAEIRELYASSDSEVVIGYSGGKDSTAVLQLWFEALSGLEPHERTRPVHVISTDTGVENPVVAGWVARSLERCGRAAADAGLPLRVHRLEPEVQDSFWVRLIGAGYAAPRPKFRWCTDRLKIRPSNRFITDVVRRGGEALLVLGTRRAESAARSANMARHATATARLAPNASLPGSLVYSPIEFWSNDEVWTYLTSRSNPWGHDNHALLSLYRGATDGGECPVVVDTSTPSCGSSRFGCWVCTLVTRDASMEAMIRNEIEHEWMEPLIELRDELDYRGDERKALDRSRRDFRRSNGTLTVFRPVGADEDTLVPGPYTQEARAMWLERVLETERLVDELAPESARPVRLISDDQLREIRRIWVADKHEVEDLAPRIHRRVTGRDGPFDTDLACGLFTDENLDLLREVVQEDDDAGELTYQLVRNVLAIGHDHVFRRRGRLAALEREIERCAYGDEAEALAAAKARAATRDAPASSAPVQLPLLDVEPPPAPAASRALRDTGPVSRPVAHER